MRTPIAIAHGNDNDGRAPMFHAAKPSLADLDPSADPAPARRLRDRLVSGIAEGAPWPEGTTWDPRVIEAMRRVPRHLFVPEASLEEAYADEPHPIGAGQTISQPTVVAIMTHALRLTGIERVLEIGTGSAYQAAILAIVAREVFTIERIERLARAAKERLDRLGFSNVHVRIGDGYAGWPDEAPFDRILCTAAAPAMPAALGEQLREGGLLVAPVGDAAQQELFVWRRHEGRLEGRSLGGVRFVPMLPGEIRGP